jgi:hypothetical protein
MSTLSVSNITDGTDTVETGYVVNGSAKAWVNFDGSGTISINKSFNVASLVDNGVGENTTNFTSSFDSANYNGTSLTKRETSTAFPSMANIDGTVTASAMKIIHNRFDNSGRTDCDLMTQTFHGDLA